MNSTAASPSGVGTARAAARAGPGAVELGPEVGRSAVPAPRSAPRPPAAPWRMPITWSGPALRSAAAIRRSPSPASATTIDAPTRQHAYTATIRSSPAGTSRATRCPGRTPSSRRPGGQIRDPLVQSAKDDRPRSTTVRVQVRDRRRRVTRAAGEPRPRAGRGAGGRRLASARAAPSARSCRRRLGASSVTRWRPGDTTGRRRAAAGRAGRRGSARVKTGSRAPQIIRAGTSASAASPSATRPARPAGMVRLERDVGDEVPDRPAPPGRPYGAAKRPPDPAGSGGPGQRRGAPDEGRRRTHDQFAQQRRPGEPDQRRWRRGRRLVTAGVGQHDPGQLVAVRAAPSPARPGRPSRGRR